MREVLIGLACATAIIACQVQGQCSSASVEYCTGSSSDPITCQGHIKNTPDGMYWESGPQDGAFLAFGPSQTYHLHFRDGQSGVLLSGDINESPLIEVSSTEQGNAPGNSWIECSVGLCNINVDQDKSSIWLQNGSCGAYWFRVVVKVTPTTISDAGTE
jgi:hypothetical protein